MEYLDDRKPQECNEERKRKINGGQKNIKVWPLGFDHLRGGPPTYFLFVGYICFDTLFREKKFKREETCYNVEYARDVILNSSLLAEDSF